MNRPIKLAFSGMKGSGKDYCLELMKNKKPVELIHYSFSDQLKKICHELFPWLDLDYPPQDKERKQFYNRAIDDFYAPRDIWTMMNVMVDIDPKILVRRVEAEYRADQSSGLVQTADFVVIKDLRPHNPEELAFCLANQFKIIYIENGKDPIKQSREDMHTTEVGYDTIKEYATATFMNRKSNDTDFINFLKGQMELWEHQQ